MIPKIPVDHINVVTRPFKGDEATIRSTMTAELEHLMEIAKDPSTINMTIASVVQSTDNHLNYRNVNASFDGDHSSGDVFGLGWRHTVSDTVSATFNRLADQMIPAYVPDGRYTQMTIGEHEVNFIANDIPEDCMCDDSTTDDED